jgi:hypothetical protein
MIRWDSFFFFFIFISSFSGRTWSLRMWLRAKDRKPKGEIVTVTKINAMQ